MLYPETSSIDTAISSPFAHVPPSVNSIVDNNINESVTVSLNLSFSSAIGGLTKENFEITNVSTGADVKICETQAINSGLSYTLTLSGI
ncbi:hypothetical protein FACS189496_2480 [Bacilli bacterium]|nr:hypothetical protein FACS189496_2480 [Bacilli bacterium]